MYISIPLYYAYMQMIFTEKSYNIGMHILCICFCVCVYTYIIYITVRCGLRISRLSFGLISALLQFRHNWTSAMYKRFLGHHFSDIKSVRGVRYTFGHNA